MAGIFASTVRRLYEEWDYRTYRLRMSLCEFWINDRFYDGPMTCRYCRALIRDLRSLGHDL